MTSQCIAASLSHRSSPNPSSTTNDDSNLLFPGSKPVQNQPRPRLMSDGAAKKKMLEGQLPSHIVVYNLPNSTQQFDEKAFTGAAQSRVKIAHGVGRHRGGVSASWDGRTTASGPYEVSEELDRGSVRRSSIRSTPGAFSGNVCTSVCLLLQVLLYLLLLVFIYANFFS